MKELKDYLHLYIGCKIQRPGINGQVLVETLDLKYASWILSFEDAKLILRRLESMTEIEGEEMYSGMTGSFEVDIPIIGGDTATIRLSPYQIQFLLSKGFDLFDLIDAGLAIEDKTTNP